MNRIGCFILALMLPVVAHGQGQKQTNALPEIGVVASSALTIEKERVIGDIAMRQLRGALPIVNDPLLEEYIQDLGNRLVSQADNIKFPFNFFLVNNKTVNAFAFYGGNVGIHTGLVVTAENENELAAVLSHEIAHVSQRHLARSLLAQQNKSPMFLASMIGGLLIAMANPEAGIATMSAGQSAAKQSSINYTRSNEREADRIGIQILARAGYNPQGATDFFRKMAEMSRGRSKQFAFIQTHPLEESRIADARARVNLYPAGQGKISSEAFALARARIEARYYATPQENVKAFRARMVNATGPELLAARYGLALSLLDNNQSAACLEIITPMLTAAPDNLYFLDVATDAWIAQGQTEHAIEVLQQVNRRIPRNRVVSLNLANAAIKGKRYTLAIEILKDYLLINPQHMLSHQLLAEAYGASGQKLQYHQTRAEMYALYAGYQRAIDELHSAYNFAREEKLEQQRIRARIEQLRGELERMKKL